MPDTMIRPAEAATRPLIIDADVHPWVVGDIAGLKNHLSRAW